MAAYMKHGHHKPNWSQTYEYSICIKVYVHIPAPPLVVNIMINNCAFPGSSSMSPFSWWFCQYLIPMWKSRRNQGRVNMSVIPITTAPWQVTLWQWLKSTLKNGSFLVAFLIVRDSVAHHLSLPFRRAILTLCGASSQVLYHLIRFLYLACPHPYK